MNSPSVDPNKVDNSLPNVLDELDIHTALVDVTGPKMWIHTNFAKLLKTSLESTGSRKDLADFARSKLGRNSKCYLYGRQTS